MSGTNPPLRSLREHPDLNQLKRQAKELLAAYHAGDAVAVAEVLGHYRGADPATFALHDAQLVVARAYGFQSWSKLKAYVGGVTAQNLKAAVRAGDVVRVRQMLNLRPELANLKLSGYDDRALHHAVAEHHVEIVRLLLEFGADPYAGMHMETLSGDFPSAFDLAAERQYSEIVALFKEKAQGATERPSDPLPPVAPEMWDALRRSDESAILAFLARHPEWIHHRGTDGMTTLHRASACLLPRVAAWLLDRNADLVGYGGLVDKARQMLDDEAAGRLRRKRFPI